MQQPLIEFQNVTLGYGRRIVLSNLNFCIFERDLLGIVGPNGTGKTTLLKGALSLLKPREGRILFHQSKGSQLRIGYVPQRQSLDDLFPVTALDVALMGRTALIGVFKRASSSDIEMAQRALAYVGLEGFDHLPFRSLSGGQKQRVLMARALATEANCLILDEPTDGMDLPSEFALIQLIQRLHREQGITVIMVSHSLNMVANTALRIGILSNGKLRLGPAEEILTSECIREVYDFDASVETVHGRRFVIPHGTDAKGG